MRYLVFTALALVLLVGASSALPNQVTQTIVATATGGDVDQGAENYVYEAGGEGTIVTQTIDMTAEGTGWVEQDANNDAYYVDGDGAVVTQSMSMEASGEDVFQNWYWGYGNYADIYGLGTTATQNIWQVADAENYAGQYAWNGAEQDSGLITQGIGQAAVAGGDIDQYAYNDVYSYGDNSAVVQDVSMDANAGGYAYQDGYNYADMYAFDTIMVDQSATLNAVAGDWVEQYFYNENWYAGTNTWSAQDIIMSGTGDDVDQYLYNYFSSDGAVSESTQVLEAAANSEGYAYQDAYNEALTFGDDVLGQSIYLNAVAADYATQYGWNDAYVYGNNLNLGQLSWISGDADYVYQDAYNYAEFMDSVTVAQDIAFTAISDDVGVDQYGYNEATNYPLYFTGGESTNSIGQSISAAATGGDISYQDLWNYADTYWNWDPSTYTVTQNNVATLSANDEAYQWMYNWVDWWYSNTGPVAMNINGDASADYVDQYHENWLEVYT
ncbi:MAG TPA: hypothetical protein PLM60_08855 [Methanoregulaceae archaeon]|jgi:hypothetical protein|nr:hypothetical protein [Methanoregulaceae archaeon]HPS23498.1 hypothetical protein [Methanoregulaceae archaeon]